MSIYRTGMFAIRGMSEFTKSGYEKAAKHFTPNALDVDLKDKVIIVTGANSGLGKEVALAVAQRGATVYMLCRNRERGEAARAEIVEKTKNEKVILKLADMGDLKELAQFVEEFKKESPRLDVLVNNAGALFDSKKTTKDGIDASFASNSLGGFFLTNSLIDVLAKSAPSRVVNVSSAGMYNVRLDLSDLEFKKGTFDGTMAYAHAKRQQVILTEMWSKKHAHLGISFYSCHPGWAETPGVQNSLPSFYETMKNMLRSTAEGADTIVWLAIANEVASKIKTGDFVQDRVSVAKHFSLAWTHHKPEEEDQLWAKLEEYVRKILAGPSS